MTLKQTGIILAILTAIFLSGWFMGRHSGKNSRGTIETEPIRGTVEAEVVAQGMTEVKPDTIFVPVRVYVPGSGRDASSSERTVSSPEHVLSDPEQAPYSTQVQAVAPEVVPIGSVEPGPERDAAIEAALVDWNTKRSYSGELFNDPRAGKLKYNFDVQFNRAGEIGYQFEPAPAPKPRTRLRPTIGGEYYTNGQYTFGGGVQYGAFGLNVRALRLPKSAEGRGLALGVGAQIIF